jgi:hypothetical protein
MHSGVQWIRETVQLQTFPITVDHADTNRERNISNFKYKLIKTCFRNNVNEKNSPAADGGLQREM